MSYCVNCGVELDPSLKKCPLCKVPVINPAEKAEETAVNTYPSQRDMNVPSINKTMWVKLLSIILVTPAAICLLTNLLYNGTVSWSLYAVGGIVVAWVIGVSPFLFKKPAAIKWIIFDVIAVLAYLKLIEFSAANNTWFLPAALPIVLGMAVLTLIITILIQRKVLRELYIAAAIFLAIGILLVGVEIVLDLYLTGKLSVEWSLFAAVSCLAMTIVFVILERQKRIKDQMKRRFHI
jgi:hypothetical protein